MSICKDCIHNDVCTYGENRSNGMYCTGVKCKQYKSTADVVEVVRCNDCEHFDLSITGTPVCTFEKNSPQMVSRQHYCSYGERREG